MTATAMAYYDDDWSLFTIIECAMFAALIYITQGAFRGVACLLAYVASVVVRVSSRVIALQPALSPVGATASSCESWMSLQIWSAQLRGGLPRGRRHEGGADDDRMAMPWVPGGRRHMCPKALTRRLRMVVISGCCPVRA